MADQRRLTGYRRPDGTVGTRNHVAILPVDDLSNAAAEGVASLIPGTLALPHAFGRLQFGEDLELTFRTLIGVGSNPNVAAVVVIGIEPNWTARVADGIAKTGKPVHAISIEGRGDLKVVEEVSHVAQQFLQDASELQREPVERSEVLLTMKDGESDTTTGLGSCRVTAYLVDKWVDDGGTVIFGETSELTGGEHLVAERCATDEVRARFQSLYDDYIDMIEQTGANLLGSQPTQGNIAGGLSTIEEKALGNIVKSASVNVARPGDDVVAQRLCERVVAHQRGFDQIKLGTDETDHGRTTLTVSPSDHSTRSGGSGSRCRDPRSTRRGGRALGRLGCSKQRGSPTASVCRCPQPRTSGPQVHDADHGWRKRVYSRQSPTGRRAGPEPAKRLARLRQLTDQLRRSRIVGLAAGARPQVGHCAGLALGVGVALADFRFEEHGADDVGPGSARA